MEKYFSIWKDGIRNSKLSEKLKGDVLSKMDFNSYYDLGLIVISVPPQAELSYVGDYVFWREGDRRYSLRAPRTSRCSRSGSSSQLLPPPPNSHPARGNTVTG